MRQYLIIILVILLITVSVGFYAWLEFFKSPTEKTAEKETPVVIEDTKIKEVEAKQEQETSPTQPSRIELSPATVTFEDGSQSTFMLAEPFILSVAAEGLGKVRFMAMSPDGRMFVPDMVNMNLSHEGKIYVLGDFDETTKQFKTKDVYLSGLRGPNSVAFYTDEDGKDWIYIALTAQILRYLYNAGDTKPQTEPETIATFPNKQVPGETSAVWHITRTMKFYDNRLHVSVGSGCNACEQPEGEMRAMIYSMTPDGNDKQIYAEGLRNAVGFTFANGELYATVNGVDHLGSDAPDDVVYKLTKGEHYGWPYCYESNGGIYPDTSRNWERVFSCAQVPLSFSAFEPHSAPLGVEYFPKDTHPILGDTFLVALHGSFEPGIGAGYHIARVSRDGKQEIFIDGFMKEQEEQFGWLFNTARAHTGEEIETPDRLGRPVDILQNDKNSFFFTDDYKGRIYYVYANDLSR